VMAASPPMRSGLAKALSRTARACWIWTWRDLEGLGEVGLLGGAELVLAAELGGERDVGGDPGRLAVGDGEVLVELDVDGGEEIEAGLQPAQLGDDRQRGAGGGEQDQDDEGGDAGGEAVTQAQRGERDGVGGR
jgi:hypothetical protein